MIKSSEDRLSAAVYLPDLRGYANDKLHTAGVVLSGLNGIIPSPHSAVNDLGTGVPPFNVLAFFIGPSHFSFLIKIFSWSDRLWTSVIVLICASQK